MKGWMAKKALPLFLSMAMIVGMNGVTVYAVSGMVAGEGETRVGLSGGLCEHHTEHTAECGYMAAKPGGGYAPMSIRRIVT